MPFRRKHRNSLFGSSRSSSDKENSGNVESNMQEPLLAQPPGLFRSHSDNSQRFCCDINPNTLGTINNLVHQHPHRNSVLSSKEKMSNLLQLNSTLVKEVASLRASQLSLTMNIAELSDQLQEKVLTADKLKMEKDGLAEEISQLGKLHRDVESSLEAEKKDVEDRLECVSLVVDNLQNMNGVLVEEAARLREDADRHVTEKRTLLADLDKVLGEKSFLEELVDSLRASEEAFRNEMQQALQQAEEEKKALCAEKEALLADKIALQCDNEELQKEVAKLASVKDGLLSQTEDLVKKKDALTVELCGMLGKHSEAVQLLNSERQAMANAQQCFEAEKRELLSNRTELESCLAALRNDHRNVAEQFEAEKERFTCEAEKLAADNAQLAHDYESAQKSIHVFLKQEKLQQDELKSLQKELLLTKSAAKEDKVQAEVKLAKVVSEKDDALRMLQNQLQEANLRIATLEEEHGAWNTRECELQSNISSLEGKLSYARNCLQEEKAHAKVKWEEARKYKEKLETASQGVTALEGKLVTEKEKHKCLEAHIQTMKGDLLVAEDAAIQANSKAKAVEKEASGMVEKKSREAAQKIGALESKLAAMVERQTDLENHLRIKENAYKVAVQAESAAKAKLKGLFEIIQEKEKSIEGYFDALRSSMQEVQNNTMKANESVASLQAEFVSLMDAKVHVAVDGNAKSSKRRGRSRAKAYRPQRAFSYIQKKP